MNKNLDKVLSEEVKRFNSIMAYQEKLGEGHHYKFYEAEGDAPTEEDPAVNAGVDTAVPDAELGAEAPATDVGVDTAVPDTEMGMEAAPVAPEGGEMIPDAAAEGDTEIDVTDLVNTSKELAGKTDSIMQKIVDSSSKIEAIINKVIIIKEEASKITFLTFMFFKNRYNIKHKYINNP